MTESNAATTDQRVQDESIKVALVDQANKDKENVKEEIKKQQKDDDNRSRQPSPDGSSTSLYVNTGLQKWHQVRANWQGHDETSSPSSSSTSTAIALDVDEIIDIIFSQRWREEEREKATFPQPVPLPQMVDLLVDLWEAEGLDI